METAARYIFEAGMLKRVKRSGWWAEKVENPESVADHSFRTGVIAFIIARMEGLGEADANRLCTAAVFHDMHEARLGDMHKITARYIEVTKELERKVEREQAAGMPPPIQNSILGTLDLSEKERIILKDADYLECAFQAKEYLDVGYRGAQSWIDNIGARLKTRSAKSLHAKMKTMDSNCWWKGLKRLD
ncbi:HD domain-containing protein [Candidatus Micrarchaeota archaeon]|nr:HD domain-containing protein [Candidatus Micrarchaeota archaeon]